MRVAILLLTSTMRAIGVRCAWSLATAGMLLCARPMDAQTQPLVVDSTRAVAFDRLDRTSRVLIATIYCARSTAQARAEGLFGPLDSIGRSGHCIRKDGRALGLFFNSDTAFSSAQQLRVVDLAARVPYRGPIDTTAVLAEARARSNAFFRGFPAFQRADRQFSPFSIRTEGDSIEVWLLPIEVLTGRALGGERGFIYSPDGRTFAREIDAFDRHRAVTIPDSGRVEILSREDDLPLVSELIVLNLLHGYKREVSLITRKFASRLVGVDPTSAWVHTRRP
jgi:hypothetical protein